MKRPEDLLLYDHSFDAAVSEYHDMLHEKLAGIQVDSGDIIDLDQELSRDPALLWELSRYITLIMKSDNEDGIAVREAVYRGMCFGLQLVDDIRSRPIGSGIDLSSVLMASTDEELGDEIHTQTSQYLSDRQNLDQLVAYYMPDIDPTFQYNHHVETGAALMLMLSERKQAEDILAEEVSAINPDMFD